MLLATMSGLFNRTGPQNTEQSRPKISFVRIALISYRSIPIGAKTTVNGRQNSPDLNPLDYSMWSILEEKAYAKPHPNVKSLKRAFKKAWNEITLETLIKIVDNFSKRLKV
uniref:DDE-1 domain-containing protein n=1 Tax=Acrobeloides nanus TaxID=290746 RepID=A0A914D9D3_9BILA